jgi:hypothetical protein
MPAPLYKVTSQTLEQFAGYYIPTSGAPRIDLVEYDGERLSVELEYMGKHPNSVPLADGRIVQQVGLKMRNANGCNLAYVVRQFHPSSLLTIAYKSNPGQSTNAECGSNGYVNVKVLTLPATEYENWEYRKRSTKLRLQAAYAEGTNTMMVWYNGENVWTGEVPFMPDVPYRGGFRFDNVAGRLRILE